MLRRIACLLFCAVTLLTASDSETPAFNKEELEDILRKEHSQKISNVFDAANSIQCAPSLMRLQRHQPTPAFR